MRIPIYDAEQSRNGVRIGRHRKRKWSEPDDQIISIVARYEAYASSRSYLHDLSSLVASAVRSK